MESCVFEDTGRWADIRIVDAGFQRPTPLRRHSRSFGGSGGSVGVGVGVGAGAGGSHRSARLSSVDLSKNSTSESKKGLVRRGQGSKGKGRGGGTRGDRLLAVGMQKYVVDCVAYGLVLPPLFVLFYLAFSRAPHTPTPCSSIPLRFAFFLCMHREQTTARQYQTVPSHVKEQMGEDVRTDSTRKGRIVTDNSLS